MPHHQFFIAVVLVPLFLAACGSADEKASGPALQSDMPLRSVSYFMENTTDADKMAALCEQWEGSQRPIASWPSVVASNCGNVGQAKYQIQERAQREKRNKQMGI